MSQSKRSRQAKSRPAESPQVRKQQVRNSMALLPRSLQSLAEQGMLSGGNLNETPRRPEIDGA